MPLIFTGLDQDLRKISKNSKKSHLLHPSPSPSPIPIPSPVPAEPPKKHPGGPAATQPPAQRNGWSTSNPHLRANRMSMDVNGYQDSILFMCLCLEGVRYHNSMKTSIALLKATLSYGPRAASEARMS